VSASPRVVAADIEFMWGGRLERLQRGQVIDVQPGSALEAAIGADLLLPLNAAPVTAPVQPPPVNPEEDAAPRRAPAARTRAHHAKDGSK
jgi:hypothetical protein